MRRQAKTLLIAAALVTLLATASAIPASASPAWRFEGKSLEGLEQVAGGAASSTLTVFGLTTTCDLSYLMDISNSAGTATGSVTEMTFSNCLTSDPACTVEAAEVEWLPWGLTGKVVSSFAYVVFKGIKFEITYGGEECALYGVEAFFTGTAGGRYDNTVGTFAFSPTNFAATGTEIKVFGSSVAWNALFTTEALGAHMGEVLNLG